MSGMELLLQAAERTVAWSVGPSAVGGEGRESESGFSGLASAGPPSYSHPSLPPNKRVKLAPGDSGLGHTNAPAVNSERTNTEARPARPVQVGGRAGSAFVPIESRRVNQSAWIGPNNWQNILATVTSNDDSNEANSKTNRVDEASRAVKVDDKTNAGRSKTKANKSGRGRKRKSVPLVKDVDGNDIGMGYFSMNPPSVSPSASLESSPVASPIVSQPAAEEPTAPVPPPPMNLWDANARELGTAKTVPLPVAEMCRAYLAALRRPGADQQ